MFKALLKKQFLELNSFYFVDRSSGKRKSTEKIILSVVLFAFLFLYLAGVFAVLSFSIASVMIPAGLSWLYFLLVSGISLLFGVFGSVFNTYAGIYHAKDNELLLSMPIPPMKILEARMLGVWGMGSACELLIYLPATVIFWFLGGAATVQNPALTAISQLLFFFFLSFIILAVTCLLGWVVALIAGKVKNKSFATVAISILAILLYFFFVNRSQTVVEKFLTEAGDIGQNLRQNAYPLFAFGTAATGNPLSLSAVAGISLAVLGLTVFVMAKSFYAIVNTKKGSVQKVYEKKTLQAGSQFRALLKKEFLHYLSSPNYIMNASIGSIMVPMAAVALLLKRQNIPVLLSMLEGKECFLPVFVAVIVMMFTVMNTITASSVSLEGKSIWILQSSPACVFTAFQAKISMHVILTLPPILFAVAVLIWLLPLTVAEALLVLVFSALYVVLIAVMGLVFNLLKPNLHWTNEIIAVKQGLPVCLVLLGGWVLGVSTGAVYLFLHFFIPAWLFLALLILLVSGMLVLMTRWLKNKGTRIFAGLQ